MNAKELLKPRFEVIENYPLQNKDIGDIFETYENGIDYIVDSDKFDVREYPHLFKKLNWWEKRKVEDMPKKLICKAIEDDSNVIEIQEWDIVNLIGWIDKDKRTCVSLLSFKAEFGYFPVD